MPVIIEIIEYPSDQDRQDLEKIYRDAPEWMQSDSPSRQDLPQAAQRQLLAARFNDRLLGAAWLSRQAQGATLSHLCVRTLTRRRGVATRLLDEARRLAGGPQARLSLVAPQDTALAAILAEKYQLELLTH